MNYPGQRRTDLSQKLKDDGADTALVTNPVNVTYLTGFTGDASYLVLSGKTAVLVSDDRYAAQIQDECPGLEVHIRPHSKTVEQAAGEVLAKVGAKAVGVEAGHATLGLVEVMQEQAPKATFVPLKNRVEALRAVKDMSEVEAVRAAVRAAERGFSMFKVMIREADTEKDMADALEGYVRRAGAASTSFPPVVAVGERGALPHCAPSNKPLGDGSKLLVDWGAKVNGYRSDMTRTFRSPFAVAPNRRNKMERVGHDLEDVYAVVLAAQDAAVAAVRPGVPAREVDAAARKVIDKAGFGKFFTHGLGHGLGLEIHEAPRVRQNSDDTLEPGMVITLEPGVYIPEWGGVRIEDDYLITRDGCTRLTSLPRELDAFGLPPT